MVIVRERGKEDVSSVRGGEAHMRMAVVPGRILRCSVGQMSDLATAGLHDTTERSVSTCKVVSKPPLTIYYPASLSIVDDGKNPRCFMEERGKGVRRHATRLTR